MKLYLAKLLVGLAIATPVFPSASMTPTVQTELTPQDLEVIEQLVAIAERHSSTVQEAQQAIGFAAFQEIVTLEISASQGLTRFEFFNGFSSEEENGLFFTLTLDPIGLIATFQQMSVLQLRLRETRGQKRLDVIQAYINYLQVRQASQIATYKMEQIPKNLQNLANYQYSDLTIELLTVNTRLYVALEELAARVGLSLEELKLILTDEN